MSETHPNLSVPTAFTPEEEAFGRQAHYADLWTHAWLTVIAIPEGSAHDADDCADWFLNSYKERFPDV